jgi:SPP1 gp7 family putative phage head morphogenesis protein
VTINEVRKADGLSTFDEEADKLRLPMGLTELDTYDENAGQAYSEPTQLSIPRDRANQINRRVAKAQRVEKLKSTIEGALKTAIIDKVGGKSAGPETPVKPVEIAKPEIGDEEKKWLEFQNKQLVVADEYEKKFKTKFADIFDQQKKEVLAKLDKKELSPKDFLLLTSKERKRYIRELSELFSAMIVAQSKEAYAFLGIDDAFALTNPAVKDYLKSRAFKFATPVTQETNRRLSDTLSEGIDAGEGISKLSDRVETLFADMKSTRSEVIARSETIRATNYASEQTYIQSDVVEGKRWLTALDERTCEFCDQMNGDVVKLGDAYADKGSTFVGRDGGTMQIDYETVEHPPLHPSCRCTLIPIVSKEIVVPEKKETSDDEKELVTKLDSILKDLSNEENE